MAFIDSTPQRPPAEWEVVGDFKKGGMYVKVSRIKNARRFSIETGGVSADGERTMRHIPIRWEVQGGEIFVKEPSDFSVMAELLEKAKDLIVQTLRKEGAHEARPLNGNDRGRGPSRKGKTERDRHRRRDRDDNDNG